MTTTAEEKAEEKVAQHEAKEAAAVEKDIVSLTAELVVAQSNVNQIQGELATATAKQNAAVDAAMTDAERNESARVKAKAEAQALRTGMAPL